MLCAGGYISYTSACLGVHAGGVVQKNTRPQVLPPVKLLKWSAFGPPPPSPPAPPLLLPRPVVMEYCDKGSLRHAMKRGVFHKRLGSTSVAVDLCAIVQVRLLSTLLTLCRLTQFSLASNVLWCIAGGVLVVLGCTLWVHQKLLPVLAFLHAPIQQSDESPAA